MKPKKNLRYQAKYKPDRSGQIETGGGGSYEIKVLGYLDQHWSDLLGNLAITHNDQGCTLLTGTDADQAALHGILSQFRDLGLTLIWVKPWINEEDG